MPSTPPLEQLLPASDVAGGASEATILQAEATLGVRFSPSYRSFLAQFGAACCNGFELAGLFHHPDKAAWLSSMSGKARALTEAEWQYSLHAATPALFPDTRTLWRHVVMSTLQNCRLSRGH